MKSQDIELEARDQIARALGCSRMARFEDTNDTGIMAQMLLGDKPFNQPQEISVEGMIQGVRQGMEPYIRGLQAQL